MFILNSDTAFSHCFPITAIFLFEIISFSRVQRLEITGGVWKHKTSVNSHKAPQIHISGNRSGFHELKYDFHMSYIIGYSVFILISSK